MDTLAVINPVSGKKSPRPGPVAIMAATLPDVHNLCRVVGQDRDNYLDFGVSRLYRGCGEYEAVSFAGPFTGAPHAAILLENLIVCGVENILFAGWCGAVSPDVSTGDFIIATGAYSDEGTSSHYGAADKETPLLPSESLTQHLADTLTDNGRPFHKGLIWSTDAMFRETIEKIEYYQQRNVLGVEMELSALIAVCRFRNVRIASLQVVSDEVSSLTWKPGFSEKKFKTARLEAAETVRDVCKGCVDGVN